MLLSKKIKVEISSRNRDYYLNKGYYIPTSKDANGRLRVKRGTKIEVFVYDLPPKTHSKVKVMCDYCYSFKWTQWCNYIKETREAIIKKDCCSNGLCQAKKRVDSNNKIYGVENVMQVEEHYETLKRSIYDKYGVEYISSLEEIKKKKSIAVAKTKYIKNNAPTSTQQNYIHELIGGCINYPVESSHLDICFDDSKIYVECDFSGHRLGISYGTYTEDEFESRERRRFYALRNMGFKLIRIVSYRDKLPVNKDKTIEAIQIAKDLIQLGRSWCEIDIECNLIKTSKQEIYFNFGDIKRMTPKNVDLFK